MSEHTPGPWTVAQRGTPTPAPKELAPEQRKRWNEIQADMGKPSRDNDGSFIIVAGNGEDQGPVARACFKGTAKRGQGWNTDDPVGEANARLIAAAPETAAERDRLKASNAELVGVLQGAQELRPLLLKQLGYVPECVLHYCNQARAALETTKS